MKTQFTMLLFLFIGIVSAQTGPNISWQKAIGGSLEDKGLAVIKTTDNNVLFAGETKSVNGDIIGNNGGIDILLTKMKPDGTQLWSKCFGSMYNEAFGEIINTNDGGFLLVGKTYLNIPGALFNFWVCKIDIDGNLIWKKDYGGSKVDDAKSVIQTSDGGYLIIGNSFSNDGDSPGNFGDQDILAIKISADGTLQWKKNYGGPSQDSAVQVIAANNGGYLIVGNTMSNKINGQDSPYYWSKWLVIKINEDGSFMWFKTFTGEKMNIVSSIRKFDDNSYILFGDSDSNNEDFVGNKGSVDLWVFKINNDASVIWKKNFGGQSTEIAGDFIIDDNKDMYFNSSSSSIDGDVINPTQMYDNYWVFKLNQNGDMQWQRSYGGSNIDFGTSICMLNNDLYLHGRTFSNDGDISGNHGGLDMWAAKVSKTWLSLYEDDLSKNIEVFPTFVKNEVEIKTNENIISINIVDAVGKLVTTKYKSINNSKVLDLLYLKSGIYYINIETDKQSVTKKIIKN